MDCPGVMGVVVPKPDRGAPWVQRVQHAKPDRADGSGSWPGSATGWWALVRQSSVVARRVSAGGTGRGGRDPAPRSGCCFPAFCWRRTRCAVAITPATDTESLSLADGVKHQTGMFAQQFSVQGSDRPWLGWRKRFRNSRNGRSPIKQIPVLSFFGMSDQTGTGGPIPHLLLVEVTDGKQCAGQLGLVESVQKIALILIRVAALEQVLMIVARLAPDIVAGGDPPSAQSAGVVEESLNLISELHRMSGLGFVRDGIRPENSGTPVPDIRR